MSQVHPRIAELKQRQAAEIAAAEAEIAAAESALAEAQRTDEERARASAKERQRLGKQQTADYKKRRREIKERIGVLASAAHEWQKLTNGAHHVLSVADDEQGAHLKTLQRIRADIERLILDNPLADVEADPTLLQSLADFSLDHDIPPHYTKPYQIRSLSRFVSNELSSIRNMNA